MSAKARKLLRDYEDNIMEGRVNESDYKEASNLRMKFFKDHVLSMNPMFFKTQEERDWMYIARREYNYIVLGKSILFAGLIGNVCWTAGIYWNKRMVVWPLILGSAIAYPLFHNYLFLKTNKRLFDMCNLGEQYEIGAKRNEVLRRCNEIQDCEDF